MQTITEAGIYISEECSVFQRLMKYKLVLECWIGACSILIKKIAIYGLGVVIELSW